MRVTELHYKTMEIGMIVIQRFFEAFKDGFIKDPSEMFEYDSEMYAELIEITEQIASKINESSNRDEYTIEDIREEAWEKILKRYRKDEEKQYVYVVVEQPDVTSEKEAVIVGVYEQQKDAEQAKNACCASYRQIKREAIVKEIK